MLPPRHAKDSSREIHRSQTAGPFDWRKPASDNYIVWIYAFDDRREAIEELAIQIWRNFVSALVKLRLEEEKQVRFVPRFTILDLREP